MKLIRFGEPGLEKPGVILTDQWLDVSAIVMDYNEDFFADNGLERLRNHLNSPGLSAGILPVVDPAVRLGPPVARPSKLVCIGLNYEDHARETGAPIPAEPVLFMKATTAYCGPFDDIIIPKNSSKTDWEVELAVVIGRKASYVDEASALQYVAGYCLHNDVSEREFQLERGGTWDKGKGCDTFAPIGPFLATPDEIADVNDLRLWLTVNGEPMQSGHTSSLIFKIPTLIAYVSQFMTLLPGDIISTGTPPGVGLGMKPPVYLQPGDVVELGIDGLGTSRQRVRAYAPASD
ncbi:fumarylacetoacetate hydrolase family protein [Spirosoma sordidisoli]|uniref:FAA hydrolase family protein n=1 Tax=Spirosoma sordidisoli TaxID=2502893 RepID=A0A4Q2UNX6_9BACT|nr:fumarylacetoacetate hydrolase family protein [Spirosoma sordidisoli]RYC69310.1 FAA hydrolase family protein [Spirosoma sordidisoli]